MKTDEATEDSCLAAAIRAKEREGLTSCNIEVEPFDGLVRAEALAEGIKMDHRFRL
jgi:hypothetical protein